MATILRFITWKPTRLLLWIIISAFFLNQVLFPLIISNSIHLWTLIKHRKFIYIILNIVIISIVISSTSFTPFLTTIFLKLHKSFKNSSLEYHHHDDDHHHHQSTHKVIFPPDDDDHEDSWWSLSLSQMGHEPSPEVQETAPFQVPEADRQNDSADKIIANDDDILEEKATKNTEGEGEDDEDDSLDATWRAIMESKGKENGPHLKKSDTWTAGDERRKERGGVLEGLSKYKVTVQLKKWQSFRDMIEGKELFGGGGGGGGCGGGGGGGGGERAWRSVDMALTFHDELKKRADAFIARVTHDIRLQRLESEQRFLEMINRGL